MAEEIERLLVRIEANAEHFEKSLRKMNGELRKSQKSTNDTLNRIRGDMSRTMGRAGTDMVASFRSGLSGLAPALAAAFSTQQVVQYADAYTALQNRLKAVGLEGERLKQVEDSLYAIANRNGISVAATAELYQRASMARENLGASEQDLQRIVSGTAAALKLQGTSTTEASGALLQLGQLLGGSKVQAAEFNSLVDGLPTVLQAVADGSDRWGGSVTKLTKDVKDGKVSVQEWSAAMLKGFGDIEAKADKATTTVAASLQTLNNELGRYIGQTDSSLSATQRMAEGIEALSRNLDVVVTAGGVAVVMIGSRMVVAQVAATGAAAAHTAAQISLLAAISGTSRGALAGTVAVRGLGAASMFFLTNPIGIAITAVAVAIGLIAMKGREASPVMRALGAQTETTKNALDAYEGAAQSAANATGAARIKALEHAEALREEASEAVNASKAILEKARAARVAAAQAEQAAAKAAMDRHVAGSHAGTISQSQYAAAKARYEQAAEEEFQAGYDYAASANRLERIRANERSGAYVNNIISTDDTGKDKGKKPNGPTPEELAAQREMLRLQGEVALMQAQGREDEARAIQRRIDLINLTKQYADAGMTDAETEARTYLDALHEAEDVSRQLDRDHEARLKQIEREERTAQLHNDQLISRLRYEAELARLSGDPQRMELAERELYVASRINELLHERPQLTAQERQSTAENEWDEMDRSDREGRMRDEFRRSFRDGIKAALDGDVGGFFENMADRFTDRMLDNLADNLFNILSDAMKGMNGGTGGGFWSSLFGAFSGGFGGGRATGGPVTAGRLYRINENTPNSEYFMPGANGTVLTSGQVRGLQLGAGGGGGQVVNIRVDARDAVLTDAVKGWIYDGMQQARLGAVAQVASVSMQQQRKSQFRTRR